MLARKSCTGYELKQYMELFWQAHHSQIYTVLGKMETEGYVHFEADPDTTKKNLLAHRKRRASRQRMGARRHTRAHSPR
ncbi:hypothetical protein [Listeria grandensis]|uniref:hypothetical protein n=1 Tax=Listeria grandensis TaxID=1494963 RepID=UPI003B97DB04